MASLLRKVLMGILTLILIGLNLYRLYRFEPAYSDPLDQRQPFYAGKLYTDGINPYSDSALKERWKHDAPEEHEHDLPGGPENFMLYPPMVVSFSSLFSALSWNSWRLFSYMTSFIALALLALFIYRKISGQSALLILIGIPVYKGFTPSLLLAQPLWISLLFLLLFTLWHEKNKWIAGLFLGIACLKPSLTLPLLLFLAVRDRKTLFISLGFIAAFQLPFFLHSGTDSLKFLQSWLDNMQTQNEVAFIPGHEFLRSNLTSLRAALSGIGLDFSSRIEGSVMIGISLAVLFHFRRKNQPMLLLGILLIVNFLFSYHLYYDLYTLILILPYLWNLGWPIRSMLLGLCLPWSTVFPIEINLYPAFLLGILLLLIRHALKLDEGSPQPVIR